MRQRYKVFNLGFFELFPLDLLILEKYHFFVTNIHSKDKLLTLKFIKAHNETSN